jgi:uncharacterized protein
VNKITDEDGRRAVKLARQVVEAHLDRVSSSDSLLSDPVNIDNGTTDNNENGIDNDGNDKFGVDIGSYGLFVTLNCLDTNSQEQLRGCIGFPLAEKSLYHSIIDASIAAATQDPRFPPITKEEMARVIFEVSILTPPAEIKVQDPRQYLEAIKIGRDGLILKWEHGSGLLLPQVPVELGWDAEEYLANLCYKAGAPPDTWLVPFTKLYSFQACIYKEVKPKGEIIKVTL